MGLKIFKILLLLKILEHGAGLLLCLTCGVVQQGGPKVE